MIERPARHWPVFLALGLIFLAGLAIRLYDLTDPPLDFHPARQFHSALISRGMFAASGGGDYTDWQRERAVAMGQAEAIIEPPVLETLVAWTYRAMGSEHLWVARIWSSLFWLLGGVFLWSLASRWSGPAGGLAAALYYLVLPYAVFASRSFQPDPLMVMLILAGLWALAGWLRAPSWGRAAAAGLLLGLALLVKQVSVFVLGGAAAGLVLASLPWRKALRTRQLWAIVVLAALPVAAYNLYGLLGAGFLGGQYSLRFFPRLWIDPAFYIRWAQKIDQTVGLGPFLLAALGTLLARSKPYRGLLIGWLAGYLVYGFTFAYHISTHDYYQLPLIPWVALGLAPLAAWIYDGLRQAWPRAFASAALAALLAAGSLFSLYQTRSTLKKADYRAEPALWYGLAGQMNFDSGAVIGLFDDYGVRLQYYGYLNPTYWFSTGDLEMRALAGQEQAREEFAALTEGKAFFVVTHLEDFERQPELKQLLESYPLFAQGPGYLVYDLRP
ncbi:MAG TPA: glycosyltransferase family 39 protein [Chloroflexi bacterium]|nr:glycosyltransferase family 39 protein [Chloroflexota bacterium]